jgi:uncharacterized protein (DUF2267 family)
VNAPGMISLHTRAARLLAVEVLLAEPETLADDVLESCLYILRDRLQGNDCDNAAAPTRPQDDPA